ncbi:MAG TPA: DUF4062 domain-containing protein [Cyclobacteriaceae bacterium]|nr:DUF4062 domain-containing protein [Cyclobacteriaceae bacterium]
MPVLKVFISSTLTDLSDLRDQLSTFLNEYGFDPILSENNDVFYDPNLGVMESCLESVKNSNLFILIIGGHYGSIYDHKNSTSIVMAEYETAQSTGVPIFTFVKKDIINGLNFFKKNKRISKKLTLPGIDNQEDALKIFKFLDSIIGKEKNNAIFIFERTSDIKLALKKQFAAYFFKMLLDQKSDIIRQPHKIQVHDIEYNLNEITIEFDLDHGIYKLELHKILRNTSSKPISQVLFHFLSNVYPEDPEKSYKYYLNNPVFWDNINIRAWDASGDLKIKLINDYGSRKDFLILFQKNEVEDPILEGEEREFWYQYNVPFNVWGPYIDRPIAFPTKMCKVHLIVPTILSINVGGYQLSPFRQKLYLEQKITKDITNTSTHFYWASDRLVVGDTYQIYWSDFIGQGYGRTEAVTTNQTYVNQ